MLMKAQAKALAAAALLLVSAALPAGPALAGTKPYVGEIRLIAQKHCPGYSLTANGRLLQIRQSMALFALIGTNYGGDGQTTFALPDIPPVEGMHGTPLTYCITVHGDYPAWP